jgi:hypothetical protein
VSANRGRCAYELFTAEETGHRSRYVTELYSGLLNRVPEQAGWVFQRSALAAMDAQGDPVTARDALISNFIAAAEFTAVYGRRSDAEFVRIVYRVSADCGTGSYSSRAGMATEYDYTAA